eukprot:1185791-Prorocentrum_minimum.AAC.3
MICVVLCLGAWSGRLRPNQVHWYYRDHLRPTDPALPLLGFREFIGCFLEKNPDFWLLLIRSNFKRKSPGGQCRGHSIAEENARICAVFMPAQPRGGRYPCASTSRI